MADPHRRCALHRLVAPLGLAAMFGAAGLTGAMAAVPPAAASPGAASATAASAASVRAAAPATVLFTIADDRITESSGLATSRRFKGVVYTHNDSEDDARVFALGSDGRTRAVLTLDGAEARDWEAIATGSDDDGRPALYIGDIGDNLGGAWSEIWIYRILEPKELTDRTVSYQRFRFRYADGPRDAEAMLVDPGTNRIYIVSKEASGGAFYAAPQQLSTTEVNVLKKVADAPAMVTDGAFSPDGSRIVLRDYVFAYVFVRPDNELARLTLPVQSQGESITYTRDGRSLLSGSEGPHAKVWKVPLPRVALPSELRTSPPTTPAPDTSDEDAEALEFGGNLLALLIAGGTGYLLFRIFRPRK